jgi:hypothetical protein
VDERFLQLLAKFTQQGRNLSDKQKTNLFAPNVRAGERAGREEDKQGRVRGRHEPADCRKQNPCRRLWTAI